MRLCADEWMSALGMDGVDEGARARVEALQWTVAEDLLRLGQTVVIEWGVWSRAERDVIRERCRELGAAVELRYFEAPVGVLWERLVERNVSDPGRSVVQYEDLVRWASVFEPPEQEEIALFDASASP